MNKMIKMNKIVTASALTALMFLVGCTDSNNAERILSNDGYTDIKITGYSMFACSEDDFQKTGFTAKKNGNVVKGAVCSGVFFKNSTIRYK